ncbi:MAG: glycerophosphodiester phosphodiesterase [Bdellovibrionia bacterium]
MKPLLLNLKWKVERWPTWWQLPPLQAHRGYWQDGVLENSLESLLQAKKRNFEMAEMDVRLSKDHQVVVFHDPDLRRWGQPQVLVRDLTAHELKQKTGAPLLREVLKVTQRPEKLNIELKSDNGLESLLERKVADLTRGLPQPILFSSFNPYSLWFLSQAVPEHPRALLSTFAKEEKNNFILRHMLTAPLIKIHMLNLHHEYVDDGVLAHFTRSQIPVSLWTVNDSHKAIQYLEAGARSIITDTVLPF